jgi:hypothetical protein
MWSGDGRALYWLRVDDESNALPLNLSVTWLGAPESLSLVIETDEFRHRAMTKR